MLVPTLIGLAVALSSFLIMQFVVLRYFRRHTLPFLLAFVGFGLAAAVFIGEPAGTLYQLGWMLGMSVCVAIGLCARIINQARRG